MFCKTPNVELEMRGTSRAVLATMLLAATAASAGATHTGPPRKPERPPPPQPSTVQQQEPVKRQNFRARRADEFPPWEGFEDCPMAFPCVGAVNPY
jgi:hypothetical protein